MKRLVFSLLALAVTLPRIALLGVALLIVTLSEWLAVAQEWADKHAGKLTPDNDDWEGD